MKNEDRITIFLSPGELFWIAGHLGFKNLPFLGAFIRGQSPEEVRITIQAGFESLRERSLVRRLNPRQVEVESTLASVVRLAAVPEYVNVVGSIRKVEAPIQVYVFNARGQRVSVIFKDRFFHFSLYREDSVLQQSLVRWMAISGQISERVTPMQLSVGDIGDLLPKIWAQPDKTSELLQAQGCSAEEAARLVPFFDQIQLYSTLNRVGVVEGRLVKQSQLTILGSPASLWVNECGEVVPKTLDLQVAPARQAAILVMRYMRPEIPLDSPENTPVIE